MGKLRQIKMIWKIMWWRRFNDLRQTNIEIKITRKTIKTLKLSEYINNNILIFSSVKELKDELIKNDIKKLGDELGVITDAYKSN